MATMSTSFILQRARTLRPGCFAAVMATGIAAIDADQHGMEWLARVLFALNVAMFACLLVLLLVRCAVFRREITADFQDPRRGVGFFTLVAAAAVLGSQSLLLDPGRNAAWALEGFAALVWIGLIYLFFFVAMTRPVKSDPTHGVDGGWLVAVVATQAVAILATLLATAPTWHPELLFGALCLFLLGGALYLLIITLVVYRMVFLALHAHDFTPPYWINMGALAISTLAGSLLVSRTADGSALFGLLPFVKGFTLLFWATASWWIPLLAILWLWRHLWKRVPLRYDPAVWNIVFPIGMYTVATFELAHALQLDFLPTVSAVGVYINLAVWAIVAVGFIARAFQVARRRTRHGP